MAISKILVFRTDFEHFPLWSHTEAWMWWYARNWNQWEGKKYQSQVVLITSFWTDYKIKIPKVKSMYHFDILFTIVFPGGILQSEKFHGSWITLTNAKERSRGASLLMVMDGVLLCSLMEQGNGLLSDWGIHLCAIKPSWVYGKDSRFCFPKSRAHLPLLLGVFS